MIRETLDETRGRWGETEEAQIATSLRYADQEPVVVHVRKRGIRYDLDDGGAAVAAAGRPAGWLAVAERVADELALNVNRAGVVFVQSFEGRDLDALAERVAETSRAVFAELLEL